MEDNGEFDEDEYEDEDEDEYEEEGEEIDGGGQAAAKPHAGLGLSEAALPGCASADGIQLRRWQWSLSRASPRTMQNNE